jgi:hypothetical protein
VLAVVAGTDLALPERAFEVLKDFIYEIFSEYPETTVRVGPIHPRNVAIQYIRECRNS